MAAGLNALFDKRRLALTRARLRAWWEGDDFDEAAAIAALDLAANSNEPGDAESELFDEPEFELPARLTALSLIWGEGRVRPGDDALDGLEPARIGIAPMACLRSSDQGLRRPWRRSRRRILARSMSSSGARRASRRSSTACARPSWKVASLSPGSILRRTSGSRRNMMAS